jgi:hypothetical protein
LAIGETHWKNTCDVNLSGIDVDAAINTRSRTSAEVDRSAPGCASDQPEHLCGDKAALYCVVW